MEQMKATLNSLKKINNKYFDEFNKNYTSFITKEEQGFPSELYEIAIEAQVLVSILGSTAMKRLDYIGFNMLYPCSNHVDWFNWKEKAKESKVPHAIYLSIANRITSEFKRMETFLEKGEWDAYSSLSKSDFSVSCDKYLKYFQDDLPIEKNDNNYDDIDQYENSKIHIENFNFNRDVEAINSLDKIHKSSSISSNITNVVSKILGM